MAIRYKGNNFIGPAAEALTFAALGTASPLARSGPGARWTADTGAVTHVVTRTAANVVAVVVET